jgi:hypothetical protein
MSGPLVSVRTTAMMPSLMEISRFGVAEAKVVDGRATER